MKLEACKRTTEMKHPTLEKKKFSNFKTNERNINSKQNEKSPSLDWDLKIQNKIVVEL